MGSPSMDRIIAVLHGRISRRGFRSVERVEKCWDFTDSIEILHDKKPQARRLY